MTIFFKHEFAKTRQKCTLFLKYTEENNIITLIKMATRFFIFAAIICHFVKKLVGNSRRRLIDILKYKIEVLSQLEMTYPPILDPLFAIQNEKKKE